MFIVKYLSKKTSPVSATCFEIISIFKHFKVNNNFLSDNNESGLKSKYLLICHSELVSESTDTLKVKDSDPSADGRNDKKNLFRLDSTMIYNMYPDTSQGYYGAIRNNSNKQVEFIYQKDTIPEIIYDFNLNLGDTIKNGYGKYEEYKLIVISIDSVNYCGKYHKRYNLNDSSIMNQSLIEGIGFNSGLINPWFHQFEVETRLVCYTERNNDYCKPCDLLSSIKPINTKNSIKIYPNPSLGKINIDVENIDANKQFEIKIIDLIGKIIYKKTCKTKSLQIDMSNQSSGIYNAIITTKNNIYCKQFVKQ